MKAEVPGVLHLQKGFLYCTSLTNNVHILNMRTVLQPFHLSSLLQKKQQIPSRKPTLCCIITGSHHPVKSVQNKISYTCAHTHTYTPLMFGSWSFICRRVNCCILCLCETINSFPINLPPPGEAATPAVNFLPKGTMHHFCRLSPLLCGQASGWGQDEDAWTPFFSSNFRMEGPNSLLMHMLTSAGLCQWTPTEDRMATVGTLHLLTDSKFDSMDFGWGPLWLWTACAMPSRIRESRSWCCWYLARLGLKRSISRWNTLCSCIKSASLFKEKKKSLLSKSCSLVPEEENVVVPVQLLEKSPYLSQNLPPQLTLLLAGSARKVKDWMGHGNWTKEDRFRQPLFIGFLCCCPCWNCSMNREGFSS